MKTPHWMRLSVPVATFEANGDERFLWKRFGFTLSEIDGREVAVTIYAVVSAADAAEAFRAVKNRFAGVTIEHCSPKPAGWLPSPLTGFPEPELAAL